MKALLYFFFLNIVFCLSASDRKVPEVARSSALVRSAKAQSSRDFAMLSAMLINAQKNKKESELIGKNPLSVAGSKKFDAKHRKKSFDDLLQKMNDPIRTFKHSKLSTKADWSPDFRHVATASPIEAYIWDFNTGEKKHTLSHADINQMSFSPNSHYLMTRSTDDEDEDVVCIWDANTGKKKHTFKDDENTRLLASSKVSWSVNSKKVFAHLGSTVAIWDVDTGKKRVLCRAVSMRSVSCSPNFRHLLACSYDNMWYVWDVSTDTEKHLLPLWSSHASNVVWSPNSQYVTVTGDASARRRSIWDVNTGGIKNLFSLDDIPREMAWSPDSGYMVTFFDTNAFICDADTGKKKHTLEHDDAVVQATFSPNSSYIVTRCRDRKAYIWDANTGSRLTTVECPGDIDSIIWSPNSQCVVANGYKDALIWDVSHINNDGANGLYMLLDLLDSYAKAPQADNNQKDLKHYKEDAQTSAASAVAVHRKVRLRNVLASPQAQAKVPGVSIKDAIDILKRFSHKMCTKTLATYGIDAGEVEFEAMQEQLFNDTPRLRLVKDILKEYVWEYEPQEVVETDEQRKDKKEEEEFNRAFAQMQEWEAHKELQTNELFANIGLSDDEKVKAHLNPVTMLARNPDGKNGNNRSPLMEVIWHCENGMSEGNKIFNLLLNFKADYMREGGNKEIREIDLAAQDYLGNTALILAIVKDRFDWALRIAQKMDKDEQWHTVFKAADRTNKTAYRLALDKKAQDKFTHDESLAALLNILEKHANVQQ